MSDCGASFTVSHLLYLTKGQTHLQIRPISNVLSVSRAMCDCGQVSTPGSISLASQVPFLTGTDVG